jgi:hypothetical protein
LRADFVDGSKNALLIYGFASGDPAGGKIFEKFDKQVWHGRTAPGLSMLGQKTDFRL